MFGLVALFTLATPDISDTPFSEADAPLTVSFSALPQARLGPPILSASRVSDEFRNSFVVPNPHAGYGAEHERRSVQTALLQKLLCTFLI
jgi:hypothetical protein